MNWHYPAIIVSILALVSNISVAPMQTTAQDACPELEGNVQTQLGESFLAILRGIEVYLEQGKSPVEIPAKFRRESGDYIDNYNTEVILADLIGKGEQSIVVTIQKGIPPIASSGGAFVFRKCESGKYTVHYISANPTSNLRFDYGEVKVAPVRLLADRSSQLLVRYGSVLSGRCLAETYLVVGLRNDSWVTFLKDEVGCGDRDVTVVTRIIARDPDSTGRKGLMLSGAHSTGWGIYQFAVRPVRVFYLWQGDELQFEKRTYLSSAYRFHVLEDAQIALDAGNLKPALQNYQKAATEGYLKDSVSWYEFDSLDVNINDPESLAKAAKIAHQYQTAFAHFRILVLSADLTYPNRLKQMAGQIALRYPAGKPAHEFAELAMLFQDEFIKSGSKVQACQKVNALVARDYPNLTGLNGHVGNWGDEGEFTIDAICPF